MSQFFDKEPLSVPPERRAALAPLFSGVEETLIWSCLDGRMGEAWADRLDHPQAARIITADFAFLAGDPSSPWAEALAGSLPEFSRNPLLMIPCGKGWDAVIERVWRGRFRPTVRYAIRKEPDVFDRERLAAIAAQLPEGFRLAPIDEGLYRRLLEEDWSRDFCSNFPSWSDYRADGLGYVVLWQGEPVSGASSYAIYNGGIEIEVDTRPDFRRRGLASVCCARLILACLEQGKYPSWDAANLSSVGLAEKLGYHFSHEYSTYELAITR